MFGLVLTDRTKSFPLRCQKVSCSSSTPPSHSYLRNPSTPRKGLIQTRKNVSDNQDDLTVSFWPGKFSLSIRTQTQERWWVSAPYWSDCWNAGSSDCNESILSLEGSVVPYTVYCFLLHVHLFPLVCNIFIHFDSRIWKHVTQTYHASLISSIFKPKRAGKKMKSDFNTLKKNLVVLQTCRWQCGAVARTDTHSLPREHGSSRPNT